MGEGRKVKVCVTRCGQKRPGKHPTTFHDLPNFIVSENGVYYVNAYKSKGRRKAAGSMQPKETSRYIGLVSRPPSLPRALLSSAFTERPAAGPTACQPASQPELSLGSLDPKFPIKKASQGQAGAIGGRGRRRRRRERGGGGKTGRKEGGGKTTYSHAVESEVEVSHSLIQLCFL